MTYSSAIYSNETNNLEQAQTEKYASLVRQTGITPDHKVLEIGCGWGGLPNMSQNRLVPTCEH